MIASLLRVAAMTQRYSLLLVSSWPRLLELVYWPMMQILVWGTLQLYLSERSSSFAQISGTLVGGVLLFDVLVRGQLGLSVTFLEETWSSNLGNLLMSPLRPVELVASMMVMSVLRALMGLAPVTVAAFFLFDFNIYRLGYCLVPFFVNLILTSWAIGLIVSGLVLRHGAAAESLAWSLVFALLPLCCVYYPVSVLPEWLQPISLALAPTYVFEGLRAMLLDNTFRADLMWRAVALNALYLAAALYGFLRLLESARASGSLMSGGA
jgi:ABC-2 type transport system permease protein